MIKIKEFENAYTVFSPENNGFYSVKLYSNLGHLEDKILCDTYKGALEYLRAFNAIAKNM